MKRPIALILIVLSALTIISCSSNAPAPGYAGITFSLQWPDDTANYAPGIFRAAPAGVATVRMSVSAPDMTTMSQDFPAAAGTGSITNVPPGVNRTITFEGLDGSNAVTYRATVAGITLTAGQTYNCGTVTMASVSGGGSAPTNGLVAYYPFNGNANDASGNGNNGTVNGASLTADRFGNANRAYSFNGNNTYITIANNTNLSFNQTAPMSIAIWTYRTSTSTAQHLIGKRSSCSGDTYNYSLTLDCIYHNGLCFGGRAFSGSDTALCTTGGTNDLPLNRWTHIVAAFNGSSTTLYINGQPITNGNGRSGSLGVPDSSALTIGTSGTCASLGQAFGGLIDDVRIYNRALSASEIQALYNEGTTSAVPSAPAGVIAAAGNGQNIISWNSVTGATSHNVYWSTTSGVTTTSGTKITGATSPYTHAGLTNGTTCYYVVTAVNDSGESGESQQASATPSLASVPYDTWIATGDLNQSRGLNSATLLPDGKVLVAGGGSNFQPDGGGDYYNSAEIYDPVSGLFTYTGNMGLPRGWHRGGSPGVTLLNNGKVLMVGGWDDTNGSVQPGGSLEHASSELYDPSGGIFVNTGSMSFGDAHHTATVLQDGWVLVAGQTSAIYDPSTGAFSSTGAMVYSRSFHTATLLPNGKVLITGGFIPPNDNTAPPLNTAEIFDPVTGTFSQTGSMNSPRGFHQATLLPDGKVFITGGTSTSVWGGSTPTHLMSAEIYDPATGLFSVATNMNYGRFNHTAIPLLNGKILIAGGNGTGGDMARCELYDPLSGHFTLTGNMTAARSWHLATLLADGSILVTGGNRRAAERYIPSPPADATPPATPSISINTGAASTNDRNVTLALSASDDTGVVGYYASESSSAPLAVLSTWMPIASVMNYSGTAPFTLSPGSGVKTVYVWFKDVAGNISSVTNDSINFVP